MAQRGISHEYAVRAGKIRQLSGWLAAIMSLLLAGFLVIQSTQFLIQPKSDDNLTSSGKVIFLLSGRQDSSIYHLIKAGLDRIGYDTGLFVLPDLSDLAAIENLQAQADHSGSFWLVASGSGALQAWRAAGMIDELDGLFLISPQNLRQMTQNEPADWPPGWSTVIQTAEYSHQAFGSRDFFEWLSGEDADLFPGHRAGFALPLQYAASNGRTWLFIYPYLQPEMAMFSLSALPDAIGWFEDQSNARTGTSQALPETVAGQMIKALISLVLAGLLLLAVPQGLRLALSGSSDNVQAGDRPAGIGKTRPDSLVRETLLWFPAGILALTAGLAISAITDLNFGWLPPAMLMLPGCRGWIIWLGNRVERRKTANPVISSGRLWPAGSAGLVLVGMTIALAGWLAWLTNGTDFSDLRTILPFVLLVAISWPAGLSFSAGQAGWRRSIIQYLPYILLLIWALPVQSRDGLPAAVILLILAWWASGLGQAAAAASRRPVLGSFVQAVAWACAWLLPSLVSALSVLG